MPRKGVPRSQPVRLTGRDETDYLMLFNRNLFIRMSIRKSMVELRKNLVLMRELKARKPTISLRLDRTEEAPEDVALLRSILEGAKHDAILERKIEPLIMKDHIMAEIREREEDELLWRRLNTSATRR